LRQNPSFKQRRALATKIGKVFKKDMRVLSKESQNILADDLVTAFLNRLKVLKHVSESEHEVSLKIHFSDERLVIGSHSG